MHLYISKHLRSTVNREEVWGEVNGNRKIWEKVFIRASLLPIPWQPIWSKADQSAVLVYTRRDGTKQIELYYICNKGHGLYPKHPLARLIYLCWLERKEDSTVKTLPPRLKAAITQ